jgi:hypothetical protein
MGLTIQVNHLILAETNPVKRPQEWLTLQQAMMWHHSWT